MTQIVAIQYVLAIIIVPITFTITSRYFRSGFAIISNKKIKLQGTRVERLKTYFWNI